jgi:putative oxidoreductase
MFRKATDTQIDLGLLVMRLVVGTIFIAHGGQKIFTMGFDGVAGGFGQMGVPMAGIVGPFVALLEFFGGFALIAGFLARLVALGLGINMIGAMVIVHAKNGFFNPGGIEFPLLLLGGAIMLVLAGAGRWSVDAIIGRNRGEQPASSERKLRRAA